MSLARLKTVLSLPSASKTVWLLVAGIVFVLLSGLYAFFSIQAWGELNRQSDKQYSEVKSHLDATLQMKNASETEKTKKRAALKATIEVVNKSTAHCTVSPLFSWQQAMFDNNIKIKQCVSVANKLQKLKNSVSSITAHLENEQELSKLLAGIVKATPQQAGEAEWSSVSKQWGDTEVAISKMTVAKSFKPTRDHAKKQVTAIHATWQLLIAANTNKDRAKYEAAVAEIGTAYKSLNELPQVSLSSLQPLVTEFELIYSQTF